MYKDIYSKNLYYAGVFWYFSSPYWKWLYLSLSEIGTNFDIRVVYGKKSQYRFYIDRDVSFKESIIKICVV